ncbi:MAG: DUF4331 family protein [Opitutaceae bacterium]|nr:DUF4331 family protein [Verrucomicrobiales bacterium]
MKKYGKYLALCLLAAVPLIIWAADHAETPLVASDQGADIADVYAFLDPNDNTKVILAMDVHGFITPGENGNMGGFDPDVVFRLNIDNTGGSLPDKYIQISFTDQVSRSTPQTARITIPALRPQDVISFTGATTVASATAAVAPDPVITTHASGISFFAGLTDDPFFFDIPAFNRFVASVVAGAPNASLLTRGRDTFAGYNIQMIALSVPASLLKFRTNDVIGVSASTLRRRVSSRSLLGNSAETGDLVQIDRMGVPAVNTVLIPFARKQQYNRANAQGDATGRFASDIIATLTSLGTDAAHIGVLAGVAVTKGDVLRLNLALANTGPQGGTIAGAGFPNGRRPTDDVIDTLLFLVTNEALTTGDNVNANDVTFRDVFPFFARSHQPFDPGTLDDNTRN